MYKKQLIHYRCSLGQAQSIFNHFNNAADLLHQGGKLKRDPSKLNNPVGHRMVRLRQIGLEKGTLYGVSTLIVLQKLQRFGCTLDKPRQRS